MGLRKFINWPTKAQNAEINIDAEAVMKFMSNVSSKNYSEERERERSRDGNCPRCKHSGVVDRFAKVEGSGSVSGGLLYTYGSSSTDTKTVNHCSKCGHQWEKYDRKYESDKDVLQNYLSYFLRYIAGRTMWLDEFKVVKSFSAEGLWRAYRKIGSYSRRYDLKEDLTVWVLRKHCRSVYDKKTKK